MAGEKGVEHSKRVPSRLYTTEIINSLRNDISEGFEVDMSPFFDGDYELRNERITFRMTPEEEEEYEKCFMGAMYFIEKYCKFMTDNGRRIVKLRDYQKDIIHLVTDQHYDPELDEMIPDNKNVIIMASRQVGKCYSADTQIVIKTNDCVSHEKSVSIIDILNKYKKQNVLSFIKSHLVRLYNNNSIFKNAYAKLIELIETHEYKEKTISNNKFVDSIDIDEMVLSENGFVHASKLYVTKPFDVYDVQFSDGTSLKCADEHILFNTDHETVYVKDLYTGDKIIAQNGFKIVSRVIKLPYKMCMYDITVDSDEHSYFTNGVLSHNTTTTAAYITWYICFHTDRNVGIIANKEDTAKEIVDKVQEVIRGIPYFLSPGVRSWGKFGCSFDNGCKIISSATTKSASIGYTMNGILYLDEFAHIEANIAPDFWRSVYPTLSSSKTAQCIITSTPNGLENKFAELWFDNKNSFKKLRVDYWQVPGHDEEWAEQMKRDFGEEFFNQEFRLQFSSSSAALINGSDMLWTEKMLRQYSYRNLISSNQYLQDEKIEWVDGFDPNYIKEEDKFVMIIDTSDGNGDESMLSKQNKKSPDSNTICIFKVVPNSVCNMKRFRNEANMSIKDAFRYIQVGRWERNDKDEEYCGNVAAAIALDVLHGLEYDNVRIMLEMNFQGKNCLNSIKNHIKFFDDLVLKTFHRKPIPGEEKEKNKKFGFIATVSKESYCLKGRDLIRKRRIIVTDQLSFEQLRAFGWYKGKLKGISMHDDLSLPILNHIPRMLDESTFTEWLETNLYTMPDTKKKYAIDQILQRFAMEDPEGLTSEDFNKMYSYDDSGVGGGIPMRGGIPTGADFGNPGGIIPFGGFGGFGELGQMSMTDPSPW